VRPPPQRAVYSRSRASPSHPPSAITRVLGAGAPCCPSNRRSICEHYTGLLDAVPLGQRKELHRRAVVRAGGRHLEGARGSSLFPHSATPGRGPAPSRVCRAVPQTKIVDAAAYPLRRGAYLPCSPPVSGAEEYSIGTATPTSESARHYQSHSVVTRFERDTACAVCRPRDEHDRSPCLRFSKVEPLIPAYVFEHPLDPSHERLRFNGQTGVRKENEARVDRYRAVLDGFVAAGVGGGLESQHFNRPSLVFPDHSRCSREHAGRNRDPHCPLESTIVGGDDFSRWETEGIEPQYLPSLARLLRWPPSS